jgi:hypothetical protein
MGIAKSAKKEKKMRHLGTMAKTKTENLANRQRSCRFSLLPVYSIKEKKWELRKVQIAKKCKLQSGPS